jgi:Asp-tRNA(Asn)/Glu-tRNA(Gln) amidotransferase A subunit family amidase
LASQRRDGKLRLAVKDIIDMKGEVTTAGSQYLAGANSPAAADAKGLEGARCLVYRIPSP